MLFYILVIFFSGCVIPIVIVSGNDAAVDKEYKLSLQSKIRSNYYENSKLLLKYPNIHNVYVWHDSEQLFISLLNHQALSYNYSRYFKGFQLNGKQLIVGYGNNAPFIFKTHNQLNGFLFEIWKIAEEFYNFTSVFTKTETFDTVLNIYKPSHKRKLCDYSQGLNKDGSIHHNNKKQDFDVWLNIHAPTQVNNFKDFSQALNKEGYSLFMKKPTREIEQYGYLRTFSKEMWLVGLGCLIFIYICLVVTLKLLPPQYKDSSFSLCVLSVMSGICNQGTEMKLAALSSRGVLLMALMFGYLIYTAFAAVLMSNLAVDRSEFPISTIEDVQRIKSYSMCVRTHSVLYTHEVFTKLVSSNELTEQYELLPEWQNIVNGPNCVDINDHANIAEILCKDNVVIFELVSVMTKLRPYNNNIPCTYFMVSKEYFPLPNQIVYAKYWPYSRHINTLINRIRSSGILTRLVKNWLKHQEDNIEIQQPYTKIGLTRIFSIFKSYIFIFVICILMLCIEILIFNIKKATNDRKNKKTNMLTPKKQNFIK